MPNQPKTPVKGFRIPEDEYQEALSYARENGQDLSSVIRAALRRYINRERKKRRDTR